MTRLLAVVVFCVGQLMLIGVDDAIAHSFKTGFIAPMSGPEASIGRAALDGFMLATGERDAHPDQESDGHLGGLDVYVIVIDTATDHETLIAAIDTLIEREKVEIVTGLVPAELHALLRDRLAGTAAVPVFAEPVASATTMHGEPFATAFEAQFGRAPSPYATQGYTAARIIDRMVRTLGGDFSDRKATIEALRTARP